MEEMNGAEKDDQNHDDLKGKFGNDCGMRISIAAAQGGRKYMEDRVNVEVGRNLEGNLEYVFAGVYDGHGGPQASEYVRCHLHANITANKNFYSDNDEDVLAAIRQGFIRTHNNMQKIVDQWPMTASGYPCTAGTTASCAIFRNGKLYTGHVGDSAIFLGSTSNGISTVKLTDEHKPDDKVERERIENMGGSVGVKAGVSRVMWKRPIRGHQGPVRRSTVTYSIPFLAVARALGDFWSLNPANNQYVVSPDPDVSVTKLESMHKYIVMASDGLTNVLQAPKVMSLLREMEENNSKKENEAYESNPAQYILNAAFSRWGTWGTVRADNITVVCIKLEDVSIPANHDSIATEGQFINVDKELTKHPSDLIRITQNTTQRIFANPVRVVYNDKMNQMNRSHSENALNDLKIYSGPGFIVPELPLNEVNSDEEDENAAIDQINGSIVEMPKVEEDKHTNGTPTSAVSIEKLEQNIQSKKLRTPMVMARNASFNDETKNIRPRLSIDPESIGLPASYYIAASTSSLDAGSLLSPSALLQTIRTQSEISRTRQSYSVPLYMSSRCTPTWQGIPASQPSSSSSGYIWPLSKFLKRSPQEVYKFGHNIKQETCWDVEQRANSIFGRQPMIGIKKRPAEDEGTTSLKRRREENDQNFDIEAADNFPSGNGEESSNGTKGSIWGLMSSVFSKYMSQKK